MPAQGVSLPFSAWEQAVFVAIFVVFCLALVAGLLNWFSKQQDKWQSFMEKMNEDWRVWLEKSETRSCSQMEAIAQAVERVGAKLDAHDDKVDDRIRAAVDAVTQPNNRRKT